MATEIFDYTIFGTRQQILVKKLYQSLQENGVEALKTKCYENNKYFQLKFFENVFNWDLYVMWQFTRKRKQQQKWAIRQLCMKITKFCMRTRSTEIKKPFNKNNPPQNFLQVSTKFSLSF